VVEPELEEVVVAEFALVLSSLLPNLMLTPVMLFISALASLPSFVDFQNDNIEKVNIGRLKSKCIKPATGRLFCVDNEASCIK